jgi:hypothetical protein
MSLGGFKFCTAGIDAVSPEASLAPVLELFAYASCSDDGADGSEEVPVLFVVLVILVGFSEVSEALG